MLLYSLQILWPERARLYPPASPARVPAKLNHKDA
jgi:hypothetical protein